ncbi:MAG TPA: YajQ family cyclic di-GMP-binding protein [Chthonomonadaceae bacterium]|nr:YajQ family cyclic di-GMP-binding protein [Chthonomonadaceae bacterium]
MASEYSFDIVSKVDLTEVKNAIDQAERDITNRYDFRNTKTKFELEGNQVKILSDDEFHLEMVLDVFRAKLAKRNVSLKSLEYGKVEQASGGAARQTVKLRQGIPTDDAKALVRKIKESGIKAQAQIQGEAVRISGKDKDALQSVQQFVKRLEDLPYDPTFENYR